MWLNGIDQRPLQIEGLALPHRQKRQDLPDYFLQGAFMSQAAVHWSGATLNWEHGKMILACAGRSGELQLFDSPEGLYFASFLPANALACHVARMAGEGVLRCSVHYTPQSTAVDGRVKSAWLNHVGLVSEPAYETFLWRSDLDDTSLTPEARYHRARFHQIRMQARRSAALDRDAVPSPTPTRRPAARGASSQSDKLARKGHPGMARRAPSIGSALARGLGARRARDDNLADNEQLARDLGISVEELWRMRQHERAAADPMQTGLV